MSYLELLKLASPEAIVLVTALIVLALGLTKSEQIKPAVSLIAGVMSETCSQPAPWKMFSQGMVLGLARAMALYSRS